LQYYTPTAENTPLVPVLDVLKIAYHSLVLTTLMVEASNTVQNSVKTKKVTETEKFHPVAVYFSVGYATKTIQKATKYYVTTAILPDPKVHVQSTTPETPSHARTISYQETEIC
jgi:hypothetical protein